MKVLIAVQGFHGPGGGNNFPGQAPPVTPYGAEIPPGGLYGGTAPPSAPPAPPGYAPYGGAAPPPGVQYAGGQAPGAPYGDYRQTQSGTFGQQPPILGESSNCIVACQPVCPLIVTCTYKSIPRSPQIIKPWCLTTMSSCTTSSISNLGFSCKYIWNWLVLSQAFIRGSLYTVIQTTNFGCLKSLEGAFDTFHTPFYGVLSSCGDACSNAYMNVHADTST